MSISLYYIYYRYIFNNVQVIYENLVNKLLANTA